MKELIFADNEMRCCGFPAGMTVEEQNEYCRKYGLHIDTYDRYKKWLDNGYSRDILCSRRD